MEDKLARGFLLFAAALFAVPSYLLWRNALVEGWPDDFNGWLGLVMAPSFSIGSLIYLIFYRRVKKFDDELQEDMDNNTRRGSVITIVLFSLMYILVGADAAVSHFVKHEPVQEWEYYAWALMVIILIVSIVIAKTNLMEKMCDKLHNFLTREGWHILDRMIFNDMYDDKTTMENPFPEYQHFCQSCGMPLSDEVVSDNPEYCKYCHADGHCTMDCTMDEMIEVCVQFLDEFNKNTGQHLTADEYREQLRQYFPTLKRWQK